MRALVKYVGFPDFTHMGDDEQRIYDLVRNGRCMTCEQPLGEHSNFIISRAGIVGGYCSGVCHSDMAVMGFLQQVHDDLTEQIKFRGQQHPQADKTPTETEIDGIVAATDIPDSPGDDPALEDEVGE